MKKEVQIRGKTQEVFNLLCENKSLKYIQRETNISKSNIGKYLSRLHSYGYLIRVGYGDYEPAKKYKSIKTTIKKASLKTKGTLISKLRSKDYKQINSYCYFCGEELVIDTHHVKMLKEKDNSKNNLICLCPNHHAMLHRGVAELWYEGGHFFLNIFQREILLPFNNNANVKRNLFKNACKIQYDRKNNSLKFPYQIIKFNNLELQNLIKIKDKMYHQN